MEFQFLCPQGHLLDGEQSQAGQQCKCPYCQTEFLVPSPAGTPAEAAVQQPVAPAAEQPPGGGFPGIQVGPNSPGAVADGEIPQFGSVAAEQQDLLHIPCPKGHILETPRDMLGQDALCPFCQTQFRLQLESSQEYSKQREDKLQRREQKLGKAWMNWAIVIAVLVVLGVILMIAVATVK